MASVKLTVGSDATHYWELYRFLWLNSALNRATFEARPSIPANRISSPLYRFLRLNIAHLLSYPASFTSLLKVRSSWTILRNWEPLPRSLKLLCLCSLDLVLCEIHVYKEDSPGSLNLFILLCSWKLDWSFEIYYQAQFHKEGLNPILSLCYQHLYRMWGFILLNAMTTASIEVGNKLDLYKGSMVCWNLLGHFNYTWHLHVAFTTHCSTLYCKIAVYRLCNTDWIN